MGKSATVALHDLTGFEGRCDALLFCKDHSFRPPDGDELKQLRSGVLGWNLEPEDCGQFDLVVVGAHYYDDARKLRVVKAERNITLLLNHRAISATASDSSINSVVAQHIHSGRRIQVHGQFFLDSTGDGVLGAMVGADFELKETGNLGSSNLWKVDAVEKNETQIKCECKDEDPLSLAFTPASTEQPFPRDRQS